MVADAVGSLLSLSMAIALSPLPIIAAVLVVGSGRAAGFAFALGWLVGLSALALLCAYLVRGVDEIGPTGKMLLDLLRVALGLLLLWAALRKWQKRPRGGQEPAVPKWLASFDKMTVPGALRWGVVMAAANPKQIGLVLAAMAYIAEAPTMGEALVMVAVLVVLSSMTVVGIVLARALGGKGAEAGLQAIKGFMLRNNDVIAMIVFIILGAMVLGSGIYGLMA